MSRFQMGHKPSKITRASCSEGCVPCKAVCTKQPSDPNPPTQKRGDKLTSYHIITAQLSLALKAISELDFTIHQERPLLQFCLLHLCIQILLLPLAFVIGRNSGRNNKTCTGLWERCSFMKLEQRPRTRLGTFCSSQSEKNSKNINLTIRHFFLSFWSGFLFWVKRH